MVLGRVECLTWDVFPLHVERDAGGEMGREKRTRLGPVLFSLHLSTRSEPRSHKVDGRVTLERMHRVLWLWQGGDVVRA